MRRSSLFFASLLLVQGGCTHLETRPDYSTAGFDEAVTGIPYALPALRYKLAVSSNIATCPKLFTLGGQALSDGRFSLATTVEPTATYVPGERYLADYDALTSPFKTTGFAIETYPSGVLKAVNVSAEDQSGPLIKDAVAIGLSIAGLVGRVTPLAATTIGPGGRLIESTPEALQAKIAELLNDAPVGAIVCKDSTINAVAARKAASDTLKTKTTELENATKQVATWTTINASRRADRSDLIELKKALDAQTVAQTAFNLAKDASDKAKPGLAVAGELWWPTAVITAPGQDPEVPAAASMSDRDVQVLSDQLDLRAIRIVTKDRFAPWWNGLDEGLRRAFVQQYGDVAKAYGAKVDGNQEVTEPAEPIVCAGNGNVSLHRCLKRELSFSGSLRLHERPAVTQAGIGPGLHRGILVRTPQKADFSLCPAAKPRCAKKDEIVYEAGVSAPQFGQLRLLPFRNRMFEAAQLSLALREDGTLEKFEYKRTKAIAGEAAAAVKDAIGQYEAFRDKQDKKAVDALAAARAEQIADLDYQIGVLTKQQALLKLQNPGDDSAKQALEEETAQINAEVALLAAKLAKLKAEAALAAGAAGA